MRAIYSRTRAFAWGWLILGLVLATASEGGMFARYSETELIEKSDLIVVGTLIGTSVLKGSPAGREMYLGVIKVDEMLKGGTELTVVLLSLPAPGKPISSSDIHFSVGQTGLWFLRLSGSGEAGLYLADHPQRFNRIPGAEETIRSVKKLLGN